jgi:hypothetical protein
MVVLVICREFLLGALFLDWRRLSWDFQLNKRKWRLEIQYSVWGALVSDLKNLVWIERWNLVRRFHHMRLKVHIQSLIRFPNIGVCRTYLKNIVVLISADGTTPFDINPFVTHYFLCNHVTREIPLISCLITTTILKCLMEAPHV